MGFDHESEVVEGVMGWEGVCYREYGFNGEHHDTAPIGQGRCNIRGLNHQYEGGTSHTAVRARLLGVFVMDEGGVWAGERRPAVRLFCLLVSSLAQRESAIVLLRFPWIR